MVLHNKVSSEILKKRLEEETFDRVTISFYQYTSVPDPQELRDELYKSLCDLQVFGRIYVAKEGINAQINVPDFNLDKLKAYLGSFSFLKDTILDIALDHGKSFWVLKVKVRDKIVADGIEDPGFSVANKGIYLDARSFNKLATDPDTVVIDMRNHYEYEVGHFENAIEIPSDTFKEQLPMAVDMMKDKKDKNIVMYCTGGIRCEKASAWMRYNGFKNVYHLHGGIINYVNEAKAQELPIKFQGTNFVFDGRLGEKVTDKIISRCHQCGKPCDRHVNCRNEGCHLLFIQCEDCEKKHEGCCSASCKSIMELPLEERKELRKGQQNGQKIFNKSKDRLELLAIENGLS